MLKGFRNILWISRRYWKYGRCYITLSIVIRVLRSLLDDIIYVLPPMIIINLLAEGRTFHYIAAAAIGMEAVSLFKSIFPRLFSKYFARKKEEIALRLKQNVYEKAVETDYKCADIPEYYDDYAWAVNEYVEQADETYNFLLGSCRCFVGMAFMTAIIATAEPWMLLVEAAQMTLHVLVNRKMNQCRIQEKNELVPLDRRLNYYHRLFYLKDYALDMRATSLKPVILEKYHRAGKARTHVRAHYEGISVFLRMADGLVFSMATGAVMLLLVYGIQSGNISEIGMYATMLFAFYRLDDKLEDFINLLRQADSLSLNVRKIRRFFDIQPEIETGPSGGSIMPSEGKFAVELNNVGFAYENSAFSLSHLNLNIKPGERIAIVGENGVGKSTFVKLLLRLYDVQEGEILINGKSIKEYDLHRLRSRIGVAFQDTNIYAMSFRENVSIYGETSEQELEELSEKLGLRSLLEKNHGEYDTELTREFQEDGMMVSGGEAQKIALARLMSRKFSLLLLDEPSSALDPIAEYKMNEMILNAAEGTTAILVSHRLSTVRNADRIVLMDGGRIRELGTHDELMVLRGKYYEMFTLQAENYAK